jgi:hypothetical protein
MARVLPRFIDTRAEDERKLARILLETGEEAPPLNSAGATAAGDPARLRGLPAIGRGCAGAVRGTNPLAALLASARRQR